MIQGIDGIAGEDIRVTRTSGSGRDRFELTIDKLDLRSGDTVALVGPNGCGKTTALSVLSLSLIPQMQTRFELLRQNANEAPLAVHRLSRPTIRRRCMGIVQQAGADIPFLSVRDRILLRLRLAGVKRKHKRLKTTLAQFDLGALARRKPEALSQGQRQRLSLATACAMAPSFLFADEPTAAMDGEWSEKAFTIMSHMARENGSCVVVSTHDPELAKRNGFTIVNTYADTGGAGAASRVSIIGRA